MLHSWLSSHCFSSCYFAWWKVSKSPTRKHGIHYTKATQETSQGLPALAPCLLHQVLTVYNESTIRHSPPPLFPPAFLIIASSWKCLLPFNAFCRYRHPTWHVRYYALFMMTPSIRGASEIRWESECSSQPQTISTLKRNLESESENPRILPWS